MAAHQVIVDRDGAPRGDRGRRWPRWPPRSAARTPDDPGLLDEVTDLVEQPTALRGSFAEEYLRLPKEVLITVMKKHQRYFPVVRAGRTHAALLHHRAQRAGRVPRQSCARATRA